MSLQLRADTYCGPFPPQFPARARFSPVRVEDNRCAQASKQLTADHFADMAPGPNPRITQAPTFIFSITPMVALVISANDEARDDAADVCAVVRVTSQSTCLGALLARGGCVREMRDGSWRRADVSGPQGSSPSPNVSCFSCSSFRLPVVDCWIYYQQWRVMVNCMCDNKRRCQKNELSNTNGLAPRSALRVRPRSPPSCSSLARRSCSVIKLSRHNSTMAADEEWTFVPNRKSSKHRRNRCNGKIPKQNLCGGSGLYRASAGDTAKAIDGTGGGAGSTRGRTADVHQRREDVEQICCDVLSCLRALEDQLDAGCGFAHRLITYLAEPARCNQQTVDDDVARVRRCRSEAGAQADNDAVGTAANDGKRHLREIVAYGIGNFATERFRAPMLQLACLLLIRRRAAAGCAMDGSVDATSQCGRSSDVESISNSFEREQMQVPIYYYEPDILPVEKEILGSAFHMHVLDSNETGKRTLESMRSARIINTSTTVSAAIRERSGLDSGVSLFYMPHCPMRLYSNVLWAHWDHIFPPSARGRYESDQEHSSVIIFGNSFSAYDERTISSEKRSDVTNAVFRAVPYANEVPVKSNTGRSDRAGQGEIVADALRHLGVAFNDCNVISFPKIESSRSIIKGGIGSSTSEGGNTCPKRPEEWIPSLNFDWNGELK